MTENQNGLGVLGGPPPKQSNKNTLVIGYGNPLRGDDGLGWEAAQQVNNLLRGTADVLAVHQLTIDLAEPVSRYDRVIFIDAAAGDHTGEVCCTRIDPDPSAECAFTHQMQIPALLVAAEQLYGSCPEVYLLTVSSTSFGYGEMLSDDMLAALPTLLDEVRRLVA